MHLLRVVSYSQVSNVYVAGMISHNANNAVPVKFSINKLNYLQAIVAQLLRPLRDPRHSLGRASVESTPAKTLW